MPSEDTKILEFNQYQKPNKTPFIIDTNLECLIEKINWCRNNDQNSYATKGGKHIPSCLSVSTKSSFKSIENKHNLYRSKDCMKILWFSKRARNEDKTEKLKSKNIWKIQNIVKLEIIVIVQGNIEVPRIAYVV